MTLYYPDIASFQGNINLADALVICAKATEATNYVNPYYAHAKNAAGIHKPFLAYHFLHAGNAAGQAAYCYSVVGKTPLMLDVEVTTATSPDSRPSLADVSGFVDAYRKHGGIVYFVYLPKWYWQQPPMNAAPLSALANRNLLLISSVYSSYTDSGNGAGWQPYGGMTPTVWQYTDRLQFAGQKIDFNAFRGHHAGDQSAGAVIDTVNEFAALISTGKYPPLPPTHNRYIADGTHTLRQVAAAHGMTFQEAASVSLRYLNSKNSLIFRTYYDIPGGADDIMAKGMVYWL